MMTLTHPTAAVNSAPADDDALDLHPTADEVDRALEDAYWADYWAAEEAAEAWIGRELDRLAEESEAMDRLERGCLL
jgi:hypothetical protein